MRFIGAEYLIAGMLVNMAENGVESVSLEELSGYGVRVQRISKNSLVDAVFLTSRSEMISAIYDFSDYFDIVVDNNGVAHSIRISGGKEVKDLQERFLGYLPSEAYEVLTQAYGDVVA